MDTGAERSSFVARHKPSAVVLASQVSAAVVHGVVKTLETAPGDETVNPFQILLVRMLITGTGCSLYLWYRNVPEFPLGPREVRPILTLRGIGGVLGAGGMYYSIKYLTLAQATALNFLAPLSAIILSKYMDNQHFNLMDPVGAAVALAGVIMVVQPEGIFSSAGEALPPGPKPDATSTKLKGMGCGLVGVLGTTIALTTMRCIGTHAHPLTVVNYFAWLVVLVATALVTIERLAWPTSIEAWGSMVIVGVFGGLMEFLLTAGVTSDKSSVATIMIYSQVLWALALDRVFWDVRMNVWTFVGIGSVVGSLTLVSLVKEIPTLRRQGHYEAIPAFEASGGAVDGMELDTW